jgi:hypothetical protein
MQAGHHRDESVSGVLKPGFFGAVPCWSCSEAFNLANAHFDSRLRH